MCVSRSTHVDVPASLETEILDAVAALRIANGAAIAERCGVSYDGRFAAILNELVEWNLLARIGVGFQLGTLACRFATTKGKHPAPPPPRTFTVADVRNHLDAAWQALGDDSTRNGGTMTVGYDPTHATPWVLNDFESGGEQRTDSPEALLAMVLAEHGWQSPSAVAA